MSDRIAPPDGATRQYLPALLMLFVGSGCAALIYEVVWLQLLQLVIGSSAVSLGVLLGTFMGGMCLGSFLLPRYVAKRHHPLKVYAYLELGIGLMGLLLLFGMPVVSNIYTSLTGGSVWVRAIFAAICLMPPTLMMGATLPAMARWVETTPKGVSWLGFFYGGNIFGAVFGSLLAGFYLLRVYDMAIATYAAVALNATVAAIGLFLARITAYRPSEEAADATVEQAAGARAVYAAIALSGLTALSAQVIWTRLLSLLFGATVYTFSLILGAFLAGLGIGSSVGAAMARGGMNARVALGWCQMLLCGALAWAAYMLTTSLPLWPINPSISSALPASDGMWFNFQLDMARAFWVVLPGAVLWGASFPLALGAVAAPGQDPGRLVGGVYAANTVGAIVGSVITGLVLVQWVGSQQTQTILIVLSAIAGLLLLAPIAAGESGKGRMQWAVTVLLVASTGAAGLLARGVPDVHPLLVAYGRYSATWLGHEKNIIYVGEGLNAFVAVSELSTGVRNYHNAGKVQASSEPQDMRLQRMLGHITHLIPKSPQHTLVIGCGAGVTAGAVSIGPNVERVTIAEIEPLVPQSVAEYFGQYNYNVVTNTKKVKIHIDDARHFLLTTNEKFDAITSDPLDPWVKGAATLYSREFFQLVKEHLNPGGVVTLFVQLYESNPEAVKSEIGTFFEAFPNAVVWGNTNDGQGYDLVVMGQVDPTVINLDEMEAKLLSPAYAEVAQSLREIGFHSAVDLFSTYAGQKSDLGSWLADAVINTDRNLRLQYFAGLGLNLYRSGPIYAEMIANTRFPENLFTGSEPLMQALRAGIDRARGR